MRLVALSLLCAVTLYGQTPIYNGLLQSDLNAAGFKITLANLVDYAGTNVTWNVATNKFDVTGGVGTVTSITATTPIVVTPSPLVSTGVISLTSPLPATFMPALTGPVTTTAGGVATTITNGAVTYAKIQNVSANSRLLGAGSAGTGLPPAEITVGSGLTMTGTTLTAAGGGGTVTNTGGNLTANSVVLGAGTVDTKVVPGVITDGTSKITLGVSTTSVGSIALNNLTSGSVTIQPATGALSTATMTIPAGASNPVIADTGAASNFLTAISSAGAISKARPAIATLSDAGTLATWAAVTPGTNVTTWLATPSSANLRGALTDENGTGAALFSGATTPDFTTGFTIGAAAASRKMIVGNATNFVPSTETWAVPGASTNNVLKSDGTNWTAAQLAFSNLSGSATAAQMPAYTGDVTSVAGATANTLVNIPATTTIAGAAGTRGDVLYYGASGWAKLGAGTSGNQLTTNGAGADPTWAAAGGGAGAPGGSNTQVQFNDSSAFNGDANMVWNKTTKQLSLIASTGIAGLVVDTPGASFLPAIRIRDSANTRYRSDLAMGGASGGFTFNAYDDTGTVYTPIFLDGSVINFRSSANPTVAVTSTSLLAENSKYIGWAATSGNTLGAPDTALARNTAGVVEVNNGTAGTFRTLKDDITNSVTGFQVNGAAPTNYELTGNGTNFVSKASDIPNGSSAQQTGFSSNTYLAGSVITLSAGDFKVGSTYRCIFDMTKTTAGTAAPVITIYIGTGGAITDTAAQTITFAAATGVADTGMFEIWVNFRAVGASATIASVGKCAHNLAATGLTSTGAAGVGVVSNSTSSTFNSTTFTKIGVAFNGGTSYVGTNNLCQAYYSNP